MSDQTPPPPPPPSIPPSDSGENKQEPYDSSEAEKIRATYVDVYTGDEPKPLTLDNERMLVMGAHLLGLLKYFSFGLSIAGPIVIWVLYQNKSEYVKKEAEKAFLQQIVLIISLFICGCLGVLLSVILVGFLFFALMFVLFVIDFIMMIKYTLDAQNRYNSMK
ncbi:MAG: DUF4870 domain-containing protein [Sumerlaeia bacterium]